MKTYWKVEVLHNGQWVYFGSYDDKADGKLAVSIAFLQHNSFTDYRITLA